MAAQEAEPASKFAAIVGREAPSETCLLYHVLLLLCVQKSVLRNLFHIISRPELHGHFDIIGNMKQIGQTGFGKLFDEPCDASEEVDLMISSLFERTEEPFNSISCFIIESPKLF
jgi:hypothetical protein